MHVGEQFWEVEEHCYEFVEREEVEQCQCLCVFVCVEH